MKINIFIILFLVALCINAKAQFTLSASNPICGGDCNGRAEINPVAGYRFKWSNGDTIAFANSLCAGTYSCTVSDSLGGTLDTLEVSINNPRPDGYYINIFNASCPGADDGMITIQSTGANQPYSYFVGKNDSDFAYQSNLIFKDSFTHLENGNYTIITINGNGCKTVVDVSLGELSSICTGITDVPGQNFEIYPNPVADQFNGTLDVVSPNTSLQISSADGRIVTQPVPIQQNHFEIDISHLAPGIYFITLQNENERVVRKFVKE